MSQKNHKTENLGNWKPFVEQHHKEWEKVGNEHVVENHELKEKIWKGIDRKIFSPRRYILRTGCRPPEPPRAGCGCRNPG